MKILVTGATGFIGREIIAELEKNNFDVIQLRRRAKTSREKKLAKNKQILIADIANSINSTEAEKIERVDAVIHSAGLAHQFGETKREEFERVNIAGTKNVCNLAVELKAKQFILISSTAVYGIKKSSKNKNKTDQSVFVFDENSECLPQTPYAQSKLEAEKVCRKVCEDNKIPLTILRLAPVIGEANVGNVARLIELIDRRRFVWIGKGENLKSLIYKKDVAKACLKILLEKINGTEIFNLAAKPVLMKEFVGKIAARLKRKILPIGASPSVLTFIFQMNSKLFGIKKIEKLSQTVEKWLSDDIYSAEKIKVKYNFTPETSIEKAIERQIAWYKQNKV